MHNYGYSDKLKEILEKLFKKDKSLYEQLMKKIQEIINSESLEHYKNLRYNLKEFKRIHIEHFVLVFKCDEIKNLISFEDFEHQDNIYKKR